jgi:hypothetical protein
MDTVLGVDACRQGWIGVAWSEDGLTAHFAPTIGELAELAGPVAITAIDIPASPPTANARPTTWPGSCSAPASPRSS